MNGKAVVGVTSGMNIREYIGFLFNLNEISATKLTDEDLGLKVAKEFYHHPGVFNYSLPNKIHGFRSSYNKGTLHTKVPVPKLPTFKYNSDGIIVNRNGNPYTAADIKSQVKVQFTRWTKYNAEQIKEEFKEHKTPRPRKPHKGKAGRWKKTGPKPVNPLPRKVSKAGFKYRMRKAGKAASKRLKLQKKMAALQGVSPFPD